MIGLTVPANPYLSLELGHTFVLRAGDNYEEIVVVTVTDEIREILDVDCRVVVDVVVQDGDEYEAIVLTDDWFAQSITGDVYYCGEVARNFEDGVLRDLDGSFEAGIELAKSGVLIRAPPVVGEAHRQEFLIGEAEDIIQYVDTMTSPAIEEGGDNPRFPCPANGCLKTQEFIPCEPEAGEFKYYLPGTGFVLGVALENGEITGVKGMTTQFQVVVFNPLRMASIFLFSESLCSLSCSTDSSKRASVAESSLSASGKRGVVPNPESAGRST